MKSYKPQITQGSYIWAILMILFILLVSYKSMQEGRFLATSLLIVLLAVVWYFAFIFPRYIIDRGKLLYKSISGSKLINISSIRKIETNAQSLGWRLLSPYKSGLLIHFDKFEDIFVSPVHADVFIAQLCEENPNIEVL